MGPRAGRARRTSKRRKRSSRTPEKEKERETRQQATRNWPPRRQPQFRGLRFGNRFERPNAATTAASPGDKMSSAPENRHKRHFTLKDKRGRTAEYDARKLFEVRNARKNVFRTAKCVFRAFLQTLLRESNGHANKRISDCEFVLSGVSDKLCRGNQSDRNLKGVGGGNTDPKKM